jgi:hypothetical protein
MSSVRGFPVLGLCAMAAFGQTIAGPWISGSSPAIPPRQPGEASLSCRICAGPQQPRDLGSTAIDNAIRALGSNVLPGGGLAQKPPGRQFAPAPKLMHRSTARPSRRLDLRTVARNSPCSVPACRAAMW